MVARIVNNKFGGLFKETFIKENFDKKINGDFVSNWYITDVIPLKELINPKWNDTQWIEGATPQELAEIENQKQLDFLKSFMAQKKIDGDNYYNEIELSLTIVLKGLPLNELIPVNNEIEEKIKPIINEIKTGDWFNAYMKLHVTEDYVRPTHIFLGQTFDNIKIRVKSYFENNYPRE